MRPAAALLAAHVAGASGAEAETLRCVPRHPHYCGNVHVACAGRSTIKTAPMTLVLGDGVARIAVDGRDEVEARVTASPSGRVLRRDGAEGFLRVDPDLNFSERVYRGGEALMNVGVCREVDAAE